MNVDERQAQYNAVVKEAHDLGRATKVHIELLMTWSDCLEACRKAAEAGDDRVVIEEYNYVRPWSPGLWGYTPQGRTYRLVSADEQDPPWALATIQRLGKDPEAWAEEIMYRLAQEGALHFVTADDIDEFLYERGRGAAAPVAEAFIERLREE